MLDSTTKAFHALFVITHTTAVARNTPGTRTHPSNPAETRPALRQCGIVCQVSRFFLFRFFAFKHIKHKEAVQEMHTQR